MRKLSRHLASIALASYSMPQLASAQSFPFEDGRLSGWMQGGSAFRNQPTYGNNITPRRPGGTVGQDGDWWVGSFEDRPSPVVPLGQTQGDGPRGTLISPVFTIANNSIEFLLGGGDFAAGQRVDLLVEPGPGDRGGRNPSGIGSGAQVPEGNFIVHATASGSNEERMRLVRWDTSTIAGRRARIMIVDEGSGPWGHINVDDFRSSNAMAPGARTTPPVATPVGPNAVVVNTPAGAPRLRSRSATARRRAPRE